MFILDIEQDNNAPTLDQLLRDWWASLKAGLRRRFAHESLTDEITTNQDYPESLIL
ncbi:MAG: hypothetical protein ACK2U9_21610 [Anaerolineae bacterium]